MLLVTRYCCTEFGQLALLVVFILLFGFCSGFNASLIPIYLGRLCETQEYGQYYANCFTIVALERW